MPIDYPAVLNLKTNRSPFSWSDRDVILYALGIGMGSDPLNENELQFVNEAFATPKALKVVPTFASVCTWGARPGVIDLNRIMVVDGERDITFHKPIPVAATVTADARVRGVYDKGKEKGAIIQNEVIVRDSDGDRIATVLSTTVARGDGGFGGPSEGMPPPHQVPRRAPERSIDIPIRPDQALIYRLSGDRNPLHSDPEFARLAGFPRPILHGMCTYGLTCRAVLQTYADYDPSAFYRHRVRFSAPVFPGEIITVNLWRDGNSISFEARVEERRVTVASNGHTVLR
ncbi:MaoC/PaaZ C-terminal domain-containing protein [Bradyrhizobium canariense]|uniref:3-alpha,7-alpha, 12-alpha-trihydroxy-5-beta-cholest-24-enoyl-CoA hydratase n=1 Tax=Bradyrhizobium canariense TaxID=255045 RepID=A0A1X3HEU4_9BRAD|nr:MaoC/PaaZ C-terminal domain-containing protein [Bradyrhizobium canariense]OSI79131.1 3-alpha,7-alpha,12-alpha-trihydroxy-5-beta-cholest-24-enoyl-CoA hydratase [Bradyrhizobium canariense]OSI82336.1 3-alpha,7-alpha,12-alpha-trihydroxy-5-beta-cholest-24-enoyl-CoA hydratase [Bradyrhizobium canariense]OSI96629.1 3-alpha,7-alpha,12-alpha-trihydroxy-5-beta-cholest-24-enoyl-CoA hydratase [Bradyrhizobium canariense]OSI98354.1 3-alpha,7-alpha,12-alpha-trihydroxy-5-beta-cholest-24-enoyl-CoA hydratase [